MPNAKKGRSPTKRPKTRPAKPARIQKTDEDRTDGQGNGATANRETAQPATTAASDAPPVLPTQGARAKVTAPVASESPAPAADWTEVYLEKLSEHGMKVQAVKEAGSNKMTLARRRKSDAAFAEAEAAALDAGRDSVHSEITRRAIYGVDTVIQRKDGSVLIKTEYSDTLLLRLAEYQETGSWRQKQQIEHSAPAAVFPTRAARLAALEKARADEAAVLGAHGPTPPSAPPVTAPAE